MKLEADALTESTYQEILKTHFSIVPTCLGTNYLLKFVNSSADLPLKQKWLSTYGKVLLALFFLRLKHILIRLIYIYFIYIIYMIHISLHIISAWYGSFCTLCTESRFHLHNWIFYIIIICCIYFCHSWCCCFLCNFFSVFVGSVTVKWDCLLLLKIWSLVGDQKYFLMCGNWNVLWVSNWIFCTILRMWRQLCYFFPLSKI